MDSTLWYAHDPMCSYCYAYRPQWQLLQAHLPDHIKVKYLLGGLAPDSDAPMDAQTISYVKAAWHLIHDNYGTKFNFDYWEQNIPRRSTYPACRAVVVAKQHQLGHEMIAGIQDAYYQQAKNPSDLDTLIEVAVGLGLDGGDFATQLVSDETDKLLRYDIEQARVLGLDSFPSLLLVHDGNAMRIFVDYSDYRNTLKMISSALDSVAS